MSLSFLGYNTFDVLLLGTILASALLALARGFVKEVISFAAWCFALYASIAYVEPFKPFVQTWIKSDFIAETVISTVIFSVIMILARIASVAATRLTQAGGLSVVDRLVGFLFGGLRGFLLALMIYIGAVFIFDFTNQPDWLKESRLQPDMRVAAAYVVNMLPMDEDNIVNPFWTKLRQDPKLDHQNDQPVGLKKVVNELQDPKLVAERARAMRKDLSDEDKSSLDNLLGIVGNEPVATAPAQRPAAVPVPTPAPVPMPAPVPAVHRALPPPQAPAQQQQ